MRKLKDNDGIALRTYLEFKLMGKLLSESEVELILLRYPLDFGTFRVSNFAIQTYARDFGVPLVDTSKSLERVPREDVEWLYGDHPNPPVYREIARDVATAILRATNRIP